MKEPSTGVKVLLVLLSILLCLCLFVSILATTLVLDVQLLTSKDGVETIITGVLSTPARSRHLPLTAAMGGLRLSEPDAAAETGDALVSWLFDALKEQHGEELEITREQMSEFLEESTLKDFLADKTASYVSDFFNGTDTTTITSEELEQLVRENSKLIRDTFGVDMSADVENIITGFTTDMKIDQVIRDEILGGLENMTIPGGTPLFPQFQPETNGNSTDENGMINGAYTVRNLMADIRVLTSTTALTICIVICVVLIIALFFTNRMRIAGTLTCTGIPALIAGILLVIPTALLQALPELFASGEMAAMGSAIGAVTAVIAPVHYGLLGLGAALIVAAIVVKCFQSQKITT